MSWLKWEVKKSPAGQEKSCRSRKVLQVKKGPAGSLVQAQQDAAELANVKVHNGGVYHGISGAGWISLVSDIFNNMNMKTSHMGSGCEIQDKPLRRALSSLLSLPEIYLQTALSTGFHVIPLWTTKLTSLCIIEASITRRRMKRPAFSTTERKALKKRNWRELEGVAFFSCS